MQCRDMSNTSLVIGWRQRWNRRLLQFLRRRTRGDADIEDIAQETYVRLLTARNLASVHNPEAYLLRVASHVALEWRNQAPRVEAYVEIEDQMLIDDALPELEIDALEAQRRLDRMLDSVSPMMRAVLLLRLRDESSCQAISQQLEITPRQVKRYLAHGYELLRVALEG